MSRQRPQEFAPSAGAGHVGLFVARACLVSAAIIAGYLLWVSLRSGSVAGCGPESGCDKVLQSRWSKWFDLPVSSFSLLIYAALFVASLRLKGNVPVAKLRQAWQVILPASLLLLGGALWFGLLQLVVIKAICPFCMSAHLCGAIAAVLLLARLPFQTSGERGPHRHKLVGMTRSMARRLALVALGMLGLFIGGQLITAPAGHIETPISTLLAGYSNTVAAGVASLPSPAATSSAAVAEASATPRPPTSSPSTPTGSPESGRVFEIHNGQFKFNLDEVPLIGPPTAKRLMVSLFDYTCRHCRSTHKRLVEVQHAFSNDLAIIALPMPLDPKCNPTLQRTHPDHTNACFYARLGLAVVRADRSKARQFDDFIFKPERPPPAEEAMNFAAQLVGAVSLQRALADPWVEQQLRQDIAIYQVSFNAGQGAMPQTIIGKRIAVGELRLEDLYRLLSQELGLQRPPR